ncbi:hypothetical protein M406DRAFT_287283 [Cryphonectria parasitica EP155]|uniref:Nucleoporin Nup120/160 n=1 Tax=Cryphonectria parasitica (strain ATCC 38755 / EP155) TaxID=660469 RepID=A0A9P4Y9Z3_CRYP1|nr:uncharacterized protein M406DRAFT_287283 [Cryphonectria parasitica EP155]KAF3769180.1 hypothetical protein M406DRAFT_287283 [Cryphonectria parasitica EP155]
MDVDPRIAHKETRVNLEPASAASLVHIRLPSPTTGRSRDRRLNGADKYGDEERLYRSKNLATAASIYHRKHHQFPRSFLWRVLEDDYVLNLRAADICKTANADDANLILHLRFPNPIRPSCVALADAPEHDALSVFVLDQSNYLYTVTLRPDHFRKPSATENGLGDACKAHLAGTFSFKHPHRLVAVSAYQVIVTFHDGGIIRFDRSKSHDAAGHMWKETNFSAQGWAKGLRSLVPFSFQGGQTVRHGKANMELTAATSVASDSLGVEGADFLFTVCLDHRLRIWNVRTGAILYTADMLGVERNPQELGKWIIDPVRDNLVRIVGRVEGRRTLVAYSPVENEFKFWKVEAKDDSTIYVHDMFPDQHLIPPAPSSGDVWTLADFGVAQPTGATIHLWVLWKNNLAYRAQRVELSSSKPSDTAAEWDSSKWSSVEIDNVATHVDAASSGDPTDSTEKWLQAIFYPGRFSKATLEAALAMYERGLGSKETSARNGRGLVESICSVLGSTVTLGKLSAGEMDHEQFRAHGEVQWRRFHRLIMELDKQRGEALSLALDHNSGVAWVLCADLVAIMHRCSDLEQIYYNPHTDEDDADNVTSLITAGLGLVENFSDTIMQQSSVALRVELFEEPAKTDMERIQRFFDESGCWRGISEEDAAQVIQTLGSDFRIVTPALYQGLIELFETDEDAGGSEDPHPLTEFGRKLVVKLVQETAAMQWQVLLSQLLLLVHMEYEYDEDNEDSALHARFDIGQVYRQIIEALRRLELVRWLVKTQITVPLLKSERSSGSSPNASKRPEETRTITAFEAFISHLLGLEDVDGEPLASSLTDVVIDVCAPNSSIELSPVLIQCSLLKRDQPHLALELSPFCNQDPFSVYIQGRVFLSLKDYTSAAGYFKKAAVGMSVPMKNADLRTGGLLDEMEKRLLNSGPANYYAHIVSLYDRHKAFSYVIDFARLSLQFARADDALIMRREMSSRLFAASTSISRFEMAHATLLSMEDRALKHSCLKRLVERMCETSQTAELIALPFSGLQEEVDDILFQRCKSTKEVVRGTPYHKILYAWRITHNDYRGAAAVLHDRLQKLRQAGDGDNLSGGDVLDTSVTKQFLMLINALSCVDPKQAWITIEEASESGGVPGKAAKRRVVTLAELRRQYQAELDRIAAIQNNQFGLAAEDDDAMVLDQ